MRYWLQSQNYIFLDTLYMYVQYMYMCCFCYLITTDLYATISSSGWTQSETTLQSSPVITALGVPCTIHLNKLVNDL